MSEQNVSSVNVVKQQQDQERARVNLGRHQAQCSICRSECREEIEERWINWAHTLQLAREYNTSRDCIYRHMHALNLFPQREKNRMGFLERILERVDQTPFNGSGLLAAFKLYMKVSSKEKETEPQQSVNAREVLARMSQAERDALARDGSIPAWLSEPTDATQDDGQAGGQKVQTSEPPQTVQ